MQRENAQYGAEIEFDDGYTDFAESEVCATVQMGET
jgi:hypothetical protein